MLQGSKASSVPKTWADFVDLEQRHDPTCCFAISTPGEVNIVIEADTPEDAEVRNPFHRDVSFCLV